MNGKRPQGETILTWLKTLAGRVFSNRRAPELSADPHNDHEWAEMAETVRLYYRDYYIPCLASDLACDDAQAVIEQQVLEMDLPESVEREIMREIPQWLGLDREAAPVAE